jgi:hypothetical protein
MEIRLPQALLSAVVAVKPGPGGRPLDPAHQHWAAHTDCAAHPAAFLGLGRARELIDPPMDTLLDGARKT